MENEQRITDPEEIAAYVASARALYWAENPSIEIAEEPVVMRTPTGARVAVWLPVDAEDLAALNAVRNL
jgi:hypothetical protein